MCASDHSSINDKEVSMHITERLITGYDEDKPVVAVNLASDGARVVLTSTSDDGETEVKSAWQQPTDAFETARELLERLTKAPTATSC
jgi:hypothetical protein